MPRRTAGSPPRDFEAEIRKLESDLYMARHAIIAMVVSDDLRSTLQAELHVNTFEEFGEWEEWTIGRCLDAATVSAAEPWSSRERAFCPLCRDGTQYSEGFTLPVGLERHLAGTHRQIRCSPFAAAYELCRTRLIEERDKRKPSLGSHRDKDWLPPWSRPIKATPIADEAPADQSRVKATVIDLAARRSQKPHD
jgi:hypothetical protein